MTIPYITKDREGYSITTIQVTEQADTPTVQVKAQVKMGEKEPIRVDNGTNCASDPRIHTQAALHVPPGTVQVTPVTVQVKRLVAIMPHEWLSAAELRDLLGISHRPTFTTRYLNPAIEQGLIEMSQPNSPRSPTQKYRLTAKGMAALKNA